MRIHTPASTTPEVDIFNIPVTTVRTPAVELGECQEMVKGECQY